MIVLRCRRSSHDDAADASEQASQDRCLLETWARLTQQLQEVILGLGFAQMLRQKRVVGSGG